MLLRDYVDPFGYSALFEEKYAMEQLQEENEVKYKKKKNPNKIVTIDHCESKFMKKKLE